MFLVWFMCYFLPFFMGIFQALPCVGSVTITVTRGHHVNHERHTRGCPMFANNSSSRSKPVCTWASKLEQNFANIHSNNLQTLLPPTASCHCHNLQILL